jgi:DNA-binding transcriptional MerR regulator
MNTKNTYSIGDASKITGASQKQIRSWEAKGFIPKAYRVVSGNRAYRRFPDEQIKIIFNIMACLNEGFTLQTAVKKSVTENSLSAGGPRNA